MKGRFFEQSRYDKNKNRDIMNYLEHLNNKYERMNVIYDAFKHSVLLFLISFYHLI